MFKVLAYFKDGEDNRYEYNVGDIYPRKGYTPSAERVRGLLGRNNKRNSPLIVEVEEVKTSDKKPENVETLSVEVPEKKKTTRKRKTTKK